MKIYKVSNSLRFFVFLAIILAVSSIQSAAQAPAAPAKVVFTEKDREFALKYLNETKEDYNKQLGGLSDAQLNFRSGEGRWTIAEIAEHITVTEGALFGMITNQVMKATAPKCENIHRFGDTAIVLAITNRSQKFTAPEQIRPTGRFKTRDELLSAFDRARATTIDLMKNNKADLRNMFMENPFGMMDGVQWFIFLAGHSDRHLAQVKEVKADPNYPKR
ncbi:MAG: DinB family protein [Chloracidobacterium sp.]|nr:DinB family protein [Chloracidobacterium sp.]